MTTSSGGGGLKPLAIALAVLTVAVGAVAVLMPQPTPQPATAVVATSSPAAMQSAMPAAAKSEPAANGAQGAPTTAKAASVPEGAATAAPAAAPAAPIAEVQKVSAPAPSKMPDAPAQQAQTPPAADKAPSAETPQSLAASTRDTAKAQAKDTMKIQQVKSSRGIEAWLVEEHSVPLLAMRFVFEGGNSQDPVGKEGVANFLTAMMDEGAGDKNAQQFQEAVEENAARISFEDARDALYGSFETLTVNRAPSVELFKLAINKPRFDEEAVERIRKQLLASLAYAAKSPDKVAAKAWSAMAFPGHPYGRPADGTPETVASITREDLEAYRKRNFARDTLRVVAVGDIDAKTLSALLDDVFGDLPEKADLVPVPKTEPKPLEKLKVIEMDVPQSVVQFGMNGIARKDPDFIPAFVLNQILGGGGFASRLTEEVREKRGLAYSVYSYLQPYRHVSIFAGGVGTKNEEVGRSIDVIRSELKRMADEGPTETELANAKSYLTGSFALRFDTNAKIANQLLWMLQEDMGVDYVEKRNTLVQAVTMDDVKRVAKRLLKVDDLIVTVAGKPKGLTAAH